VLFAHSRLYGEAALQLCSSPWRSGAGGNGCAAPAPTAAAAGAPADAAQRWGARPRWRPGRCSGLLLQFGTDSDVPWLDALPTVAA
jgi:hypothetical protein